MDVGLELGRESEMQVRAEAGSDSEGGVYLRKWKQTTLVNSFYQGLVWLGFVLSPGSPAGDWLMQLAGWRLNPLSNVLETQKVVEMDQ